MSALRLPGPDGRTRLVIDEGWPEVRARHFRIGSSTGPIIYGSFPVGQATDRREQNREWRRNHREQEIERKRRERREARLRAIEQDVKRSVAIADRRRLGPVCGERLHIGRALSDVTCARAPGHAKNGHRSRESMDAARDRHAARGTR